MTRAITRRPAPSVVDGLRAIDSGPPDPALLLAQHAAYVAALREAGAAVTQLPALDDFPDSLFVEDTALCLPQGAVLLRPGAPSRAGEVAHIAAAVAALVPEVQRIETGHVEGGDILWTGREVLVGLSARTDTVGVAALRTIIEPWGHHVRILETPPGVLHFKTDCALVAADTILATNRLAGTGCFADYTVLRVPDGEEPAANAIRVNDTVLLPAGFPLTEALLSDAGHKVRCVPNSECARIDGGMSCLSLRLSG